MVVGGLLSLNLAAWMDLSDFNEVLSKDKQYEDWGGLQSYFPLTPAFCDSEWMCLEEFPQPNSSQIHWNHLRTYETSKQANKRTNKNKTGVGKMT